MRAFVSPKWGRRSITAILLAILGGCGSSEPGGGHTGMAQAANGADENGSQEKPSEPAIPVAVDIAWQGPIATYYTATATLEAEKQAEILARVSGVVERLLCEEGDRVTTGQPMLRIENAEYRLRLDQADADLANLRTKHDRLKGMSEQNLVSVEEYEAAKNDLARAEADYGLAELTLSYTTVDAPFTGRVMQRLVDPGQNISDGTPLFMLGDFEPLLARIHVPSKEFRQLEQDQPVELVLDSSRDRLSGRIKLISPTIDPASGTIKLTVEIPSYPAGTRPGDFAQVHIVTEQRNQALLVPKVAVVSEKGDEVVYISVEDAAERRVVEIGFRDDRNVQILSGVEPGDLVVVKGQRSLKHGDPLKILESQGQPTTAAATTPAPSDS